MKPLIRMYPICINPPSYGIKSEVPGENFQLEEVPSLEIADCIVSALRYRQRSILAERKRSRQGKGGGK